MIAETLAGIALVKSAVEGIKSAINTAKDINDIASHIDNLFEGEKQIQQQRIKKQTDPFAISSVASETINAKLAQEHLYEISQLVNLRFGPDTWQSIINERAKRIQEAKEKAAEVRRIEIRKAKEVEELFQTILLILAIIVVLVIVTVIAIYILN